MSSIDQHIWRNSILSIMFGVLFLSYLVILIVRKKSVNKLGCLLLEALCGIKCVIHIFIAVLYHNLNVVEVNYQSTFSKIVSISTLNKFGTAAIIILITVLLFPLCRRRKQHKKL